MAKTRAKRSRHDRFLNLAKGIAFQGVLQGACLRRVYGAVAVSPAGKVVGSGRTGAPRGERACGSIGWCWRAEHGVPSGQRYETCRSVHAEMNAMLRAGKRAKGSTVYLIGLDAGMWTPVATVPCALCARVMINSGVAKVVIGGTTGYAVVTPRRALRIREAEFGRAGRGKP